MKNPDEIWEKLIEIEKNLKKTGGKPGELSETNENKHLEADKLIETCKTCPSCCKAVKKASEKLDEDGVFDDLEDDEQSESEDDVF